MTSKNILIIGGLAVAAIYLLSQTSEKKAYNGGIGMPTQYGNLNSSPIQGEKLIYV